MQSDPRNNGCLCQRCGKRYKVDFIVPGKIWRKIKPESRAQSVGLLCGHCIVDAIEKEGFAAFNLVEL